ncbi:hypothetical protein D3C78_852700 [compost metagenome]
MLNIGALANSTPAIFIVGAMPGISASASATPSGCSSSLATAICPASASIPRTRSPYRLAPITNSAAGAEACDSMSMLRSSSAGRRSSASAHSRPAAIARISGFCASRRSVSRASWAGAPPPWRPRSASARASGIITRLSTRMPRVIASAAGGPITMTATG